MRLYWEVARRGFRRYAAYRWATFAGAFTNTVFGFLRGYILLAVFGARTDIGGFDATDTLTYAWAVQALIMTVFVWGWDEIASRVRDGSIATDLFRPMDFQGYWYALDVGRSTYHLIFRGIPPMLVGSLVFDLRLPESAARWMLVVVSVYLAVLVSLGVRYLANMASFWLLDIRGVNTMVFVISNVLSGFVVPITFFPGWLEQLARALPFASIVQIPIETMLGKGDVAEALLTQALWAVALFALGRVTLVAATRKVVIQGG